MDQKKLTSAIFTLHRYYIWANAMRVHLEETVSVYASQLAKNPDNLVTPEGILSNLYMSYWYGGLYVVVEGWKNLGLADLEIDRLLLSPNVALLRRYRNGTFHFQKDYFDERFVAFIRDGENVVDWVHQLSRAVFDRGRSGWQASSDRYLRLNDSENSRQEESVNPLRAGSDRTVEGPAQGTLLRRDPRDLSRANGRLRGSRKMANLVPRS